MEDVLGEVATQDPDEALYEGEEEEEDDSWLPPPPLRGYGSFCHL